MGKGARLRAERRGEQALQENLEGLLEAVSETRNAEGIAELVQERPELFAPEVLAHIETARDLPHAGPYLEPIGMLVRFAPENPERAWEAYTEARDLLQSALTAIEPRSEELGSMLDQRRYDEAIEVGEEVLSQAFADGLGLVVIETRERLVTAYRNAEGGDRAENIEKAIGHVDEVVQATPAPDRAGAMMNFAVLVSMRLKGDPAENFEIGVGVLRDALEEARRADDPKTTATSEMNLARTLQVRQRGEKIDNLIEARDLCRRSLTFRTLERDPVDWAYSMLNLGGIENDLIPLGAAEVGDAEGPLLELIEAGEQVEEKWLLGFAHSSLGAVHRDEARRIQHASERVSVGPGRPTPPEGEEAGRLGLARQHLESGLGLLDPARNPDTVGRTLADLAEVADHFEDEDEAIALYRTAVAHVDARLEPRLARDAGGRLGHLLAQNGEWDDAAAAFTKAVEGAELAFHARFATADRIDEGERSGNLPRWAAITIARAGDLEKALLVLENGRTRELRRRLGVGKGELELLPDDAREDYEAAQASLAALPLGADSHEAAYVLQRVVAAIREIPGREEFGTGFALADVSGAVEEGCPLLYVDPSPYGTMLLAAHRTGGEVHLETTFLERPIAFEVLMHSALGDYERLFREPQNPGESAGYLAALSNPDSDPDHLDRALVYLTATLGETLAKPIAQFLTKLGAAKATLVLCGPLAFAPVHAFRWEEDGVEVALLERFELRIAPSATLQGASIERAAERGERGVSLAALGDPDLDDPELDLPAAGAEVEEIAELFARDSRECAFRAEATSAFLERTAPSASHVHLACHGSGSLFSSDESEEPRIYLADREVTGSELVTLGLSADLTVISACETAVSSLGFQAHEALSLGAAFLAAGSSVAVASLWTVDDIATAMLMARFYREMFESGTSPAAALRSAQLWLRDLDEDEEQEFLVAHPEIEEAYRTREQAGDRPGRRGAAGAGAVVADRPYASPEFWAPFICFGAG